MVKNTAFVFGGGGSRGALQVGAVRALLEAGIFPDLLVGTSIGAVNAAFLAINGMTLPAVEALETAWKEIAGVQILDPRITSLIIRAFVGFPSENSKMRIEKFFQSKGLTPDLTFHQIEGIRLGLVSADIETGKPVIYGRTPDDSILEGLMASIALPPWFTPFKKDNHLLVDGGAVSNLPIEPALQLGATEIYALDLDDPPRNPKGNFSVSQYIDKYVFAVSRRHVDLEKALAELKGIPVHCVDFQGLISKPIWDFSDVEDQIAAGYMRTRQAIAKLAQEQTLFVYPDKEGRIPIYIFPPLYQIFLK